MEQQQDHVSPCPAQPNPLVYLALVTEWQNWGYTSSSKSNTTIKSVSDVQQGWGLAQLSRGDILGDTNTNSVSDTFCVTEATHY